MNSIRVTDIVLPSVYCPIDKNDFSEMQQQINNGDNKKFHG